MNDTPPKLHDYELTLTFKVGQYGNKVDPDLAVALNRIFHDWDEGRHPFPVEMVNEGLRMCIKHALYHCCQKRAQEKHDNEMAQTDDDCSQRLIEADKEFDELWNAGAYPGLCDQPDIKIEKVNDV